MKVFLFTLMTIFGVNCYAADMYSAAVDSESTLTSDCKVAVGKSEPSGTLTYKANHTTIQKPIYSDLCVISQEWINTLYFNNDGSIVGLAMGNTYAADGMISVSEKWLERK